MIIDSIETLERMTKQEIFEFVIKHLKDQKIQSRRTALNRDIDGTYRNKIYQTGDKKAE